MTAIVHIDRVREGQPFVIVARKRGDAEFIGEFVLKTFEPLWASACERAWKTGELLILTYQPHQTADGHRYFKLVRPPKFFNEPKTGAA